MSAGHGRDTPTAPSAPDTPRSWGTGGTDSAPSTPHSGVEPRVLFITGEYPPTVGGIGDYTATLTSHLRAAGARVAIVTGRVAGAGNEPGVWREVPNWDFSSWRAIDRAIAAERPNLIHIQYQAGAYDGRAPIHLLPWRRAMRRRKFYPHTFAGGSSLRVTQLLVTLHDLHAPYLFPKAGPLRPVALRLLTRGCAATIATNGEDWRRLGVSDLSARRLLLIPIGSNIPPVAGTDSPHGLRAKLGVRDNEILLVHFGLIGASKGLETLLDALRTLEEQVSGRYHLLLIGGEASATDRVRRGDDNDLASALRARGLTERVVVTGTLPPAAAAAHLAAADVAVLPYRDGASWRRGSLLAALTQGLPVVTSTPSPGYDADGQLPRLIDGDNALLVPPEDVMAFATAIARTANDAALRARLAIGALALAKAFGWDMIAARHLELYGATLRAATSR